MVTSIAEADRAADCAGADVRDGDRRDRRYPLRSWKNAPPNLRAVLEMQRGRGDLGFLVYEDETHDVRRALPRRRRTSPRSSATATASRRATGSPSRMRNYPEWSVAFWAAAAAGAVSSR